MTREEMIKELDRMSEGDTTLRYSVVHNGKTVAKFARRWEAEKFMEISTHHKYTLVFD